MEILFLGTGGSVPTPRRNTMAIAIRHMAEMLLLDCGEGTQRQFMRSEFSYMKLDRVFISHLHGDHFLGLPGLVQSMNFSGRERPLEIYGPRGIGDVVTTVTTLGHFELGFPIFWRELVPGDVVECPGYDVRAVGAQHISNSLGYVFKEHPRRGRFDRAKAEMLGVQVGPMFSTLQEGGTVEVDGRKVSPEMVLGPSRPGLIVAYSGDSLPTDEFVDAARGCDIMIHEATVESSLEEKAAIYGHSTAAQAAQVALRAGAKKLFLVHISGRYDDAGPLLEEAKAIFRESYLPEDLALIEVKKE
ncbi:MAG TPA: ribonuclease Z [Methanomassiliicoccales archaeon]|nr:ribonuclease Z [Methanomassiliicoccales archaeon]